jgi:hypothetical protein
VASRPHLYFAEQVGPDEPGTPMPAREPVPCVVTARFQDGYEGEAEGTATAWSDTAVHVVFAHPDPDARRWTGLYRVWVRPDRVRRSPSE